MKMIAHFLFVALFGVFSSIGFSAPKAQMTNISGSIQGAGYTTIEIGVNGKGTRISLGTASKLKEIGITEEMIGLGKVVSVKGLLSKGKAQDDMVAESITIDGRTFKLN
jgi:hypothetical protein